MKIRTVKANNKKHAFEVTVFNGQEFDFPYSQLTLKPSSTNRIREVAIDRELGKEAFTYTLESGDCDSVHIDHVLHFVNEPEYVHELLRHNLSLTANRLVAEGNVAKKELLRRLKTSPSQLDRLIDPSNTKTSIGRLLTLIVACEGKIDFSVDGESILRNEELEPA